MLAWLPRNKDKNDYILAPLYKASTACKCLYTQVTSKCRIQLELETSLGKALIEENGYSLLKINNAD